MRRAQECPDQAALLPHRICGRTNAFANRLARAVGHVLHFAIGSELPAMVEAAEAVFLNAAERERSPAVWTVLIEQSNDPGTVAKCNKVLPKQPHAQRSAVRLCKLCRGAYRQPEPPEHLAHRCAGTDSANTLVLLTI